MVPPYKMLKFANIAKFKEIYQKIESQILNNRKEWGHNLRTRQRVWIIQIKEN